MSQTARKPAETAGATRDFQRNAELMRQIGSTKGSDPIPPDQYLTYQDERYDPDRRLWSWMLARTIRYGHRSPHAVDERGRALTLEHARADLTVKGKPMDAGNLRRAWRQLEKEKRVYRDDGRLCLSGDVTLPPAETEGEEKATEVCTDLFPPYLIKQINKLPPKVRETLVTEYTAEHSAQKRVLADAAFAVRLIYDQRKDNILARHGVKQIREEHKQQSKLPLEQNPEAASRESLRRTLADLVDAHAQRSVQTFSASVQTQIPLCTDGPPPSVQTAASLLTSEITETEKTSSSSSPLSLSPELPTTTKRNGNGHGKTSAETLQDSIDREQLLEALSPYCTPDDAMVRRLLLDCRYVVPDATADEICHFIHVKGPLARRKDNPAGFLLTAIPNSLNGDAFQRFRRDRADKLRANDPEAERRRREQNLQFFRSVLDDPEASAEMKAVARAELEAHHA